MHKGMYIAPCMITLGGMFCGFFSMIATLRGDYQAAAIAIVAAGLFDMMDGKVARLMNATSKFGMQLDSLSDLLAFGVAPALLLYEWALQPFGRIGWMAVFLYVACGALRLARFNIQDDGGGSSFTGLPIPAAAGVIASFVLFVNRYVPDIDLPLFTATLGYVLAFLMVSNIQYPSFKKASYLTRKPFGVLVGVLLVFVLIGSHPEIMLSTLAVLYLFSGILLAIKRRALGRPQHNPNEVRNHEQKNHRL